MDKEIDIDVARIISTSFVPRWRIEEYRWLLARIHSCDTTSDELFQKNFVDYWHYQNYQKGWHPLVFEAIEEAKSMKHPSFGHTLRKLSTSTVQKSVTSKILGTLDPSFPIWDQYVSDVLGIREPEGGTLVDRIRDAEKKYIQLKDWYKNYLSSSKGKKVIEEFDSFLPQMVDLHPVKKVDFLLWSLGGNKK